MQNVQNIIFDLGGVIMDIDVRRTLDAFSNLGLKNIHEHFGHGFADSFFSDHETGKVSDEEFLGEIKRLLMDAGAGGVQKSPGAANEEIDNETIVTAWNALLLEFPSERIELLKKLKSSYRIFLFSNTNAIHLKKFNEIYQQTFSGKLDDLFEKAYYSHVLGHRKPDIAGFQFILEENGLDPKQTLFLDDALINVEGAIKSGLKGLYLPPGFYITDICW